MSCSVLFRWWRVVLLVVQSFFRFATGSLSFVALISGAMAASPSPVLVTAAAVRKLAPAEAARGLPVLLTAVVTFSDPRENSLFAQDRTGALFVQSTGTERGGPSTGLRGGLQTGQLVELNGITALGPSGPFLRSATVRTQGRGRLPAPRVLTAEELFAMAPVTEYVEVSGIVQAASIARPQDRLLLEIGVLDAHFMAEIPGFGKEDAPPDWLVDARLRLRGVVGPRTVRRGRELGFQLLVPSLDSVEVVRPAPNDPFASPPRPIRRVLEPDPATPPGHRVKVAGVVSLQWSDRQVFLQDATGGIYVELLHPLRAAPGTYVEAVGFLRSGSAAGQLRRAEWQLTGKQFALTPAKIRAEDVRRAERDGTWVQLQGILTGRVQRQGVEVLTVQDGQASFECQLRANRTTPALEALPLGTLVRISGVYALSAGDRQRPAGFQVLLGSASDVAVLARPPWWTMTRVVALLGLVIFAAAVWHLIYSRHVARLQRKSEEERRAMERKMLENQKLESLGVMAGGVAHDFNNLLTTIIGNAGLARMALPGDSPEQIYLRNVEKTGRQAAGLCQQLMAYTGKTLFQLQRVELGAFLEGMHPLLQASMARNAVLELELKPDTPAIEADPSQLRQVVMQLVINASEALPEGSGWIRVETRCVEADRAVLAGASVGEDLPLGEYACLEVSDNGCGMDGETLSRIFDPFFTTKFIGRGLGLAAVSGIVRAHRGALRLRSEPGHGSSFQILFPSVHPMTERPVLNDDVGNGDRASGMQTADKSTGSRE